MAGIEEASMRAYNVVFFLVYIFMSPFWDH